MKKNISLVLVIVLILGLVCLNPSANNALVDKGDYANENAEDIELNENWLHESTSECEVFPDQSNRSDLNYSADVSTCVNRICDSASYTINETSTSFLEKITQSPLLLSGYVVLDSQELININNYFEDTHTSRFDIVKIAFDNNIISENEKIMCFCILFALRLFDYVNCLHPIIIELQNYYFKDNIPPNLKNTIENTILLPDAPSDKTQSRANLSYYSYQSSNFIIYFVTGITQNEAQNTASFLESIRSAYNNMGFNEPIKEDGYSKYRVFLESESGAGVAAVTNQITNHGVACSTNIRVYNFSSLTTQIKERLAHEYFHAIQASYIWSLTNIWLDEAMANWGKIVVGGSSITCNNQINSYLSSIDPINSEETAGYGVVLLPLTIHSSFGTSAIKDIWEEYGEQTSRNLSFSQLKENVIDEALEAYNSSFDGVFLKMAYRNFHPRTWYSSVHPGGSSAISSWNERITATTNTISDPRQTKTVCSNASINSYSNNYYKFIPDMSGSNSKLTITVVFSGTNASKGVCHSYYVNNNGMHVASSLIKSGTNTYTITTDLYGDDYIWFGVVVSNVASSSINYTITYKVERGSQLSISLTSGHRYCENVITILPGEYKDITLTFATGGNKIIQTFGTLDGFLELFSSDGTKLAENDDDGYSTNALLSYNFTANVQYRIRVTFFSAITTGDIKLSIVPTYSTLMYEDFYSLEDYTLGLTWYFTQNNVLLLTYEYSSTRDLTMHVSSEVDTFLYIIDPRSTSLIVAASLSSPNMTKGYDNLYNDDINPPLDYNSQITKTFEEYIPYLVIVSAHNPSLSTSVGSFYLDFLS